MLTAFCVMAPRITKVHQRVQVGIGNSEYMATTATITTVRPAELLVLFVPERHAACPAISCRDIDKGFINEFHGAVTVTDLTNCRGFRF